jgi:hypothetical protein
MYNKCIPGDKLLDILLAVCTVNKQPFLFTRKAQPGEHLFIADQLLSL